MEFNSSLITNKLFYSDEENADSIIKDVEFNYKYILLFDYLYMGIDRNNYIKTTLEDIITYCGYKTSSKKGESNDQFREMLNYLQTNKYIFCDINLISVSPKQFVKIVPSLFYQDECGEIIKFMALPSWIKNRILNYNKDKIDNVAMLFYWCYLECRRYKYNNIDDNVRYGGRATVWSTSFSNIHKDIGLTDKTINKYNQILKELNLLRYSNNGLCYHFADENKVRRESINVYITIPDELDDIDSDDSNITEQLYRGLKETKGFEESKGFIFVNKEIYVNNDRSINGKIGAITRLENLGKATPEQLLLKQELIEMRDKNKEDYNVDYKRFKKE